MTEFTGLIPDTPEVLAQLRSELVPLPAVCFGAPKEVTFDSPPPFIALENQGAMSSCAGHGGTTAAETDLYWETGRYTQLSRLFAYQEGQKKAGINSDRGCTLSGIIRAFEDVGCPEERYAPYGPYGTRFNQAAYDNAANWRLKSKIALPSYADVRALLGQKVGAVLAGSYWPLRWDANRYVKSYGGAGGGAHAWAMVALASSKDATGKPDVWAANSHAGNYWLKLSATFCDELLGRDQFGIMGITSMTDIKSRVDWREVEGMA